MISQLWLQANTTKKVVQLLTSQKTILMRNLLFALFAFTFCGGISLFAQVNIPQIAIGTSLPGGDIEVVDISGETLTLEGVAGSNGLLVVFSCNTCPFVWGWEDRYFHVAEFCRANDIGLILLNPNEARRDGGDSFEDMQEYARDKGYDFYYALDKDHALADLFGATRTPDVFLFNQDMVLVYKGAIDDNMKEPEKVEESFLKNALSNMLAGVDIDPDFTKAIGCTIKRLDQ